MKRLTKLPQEFTFLDLDNYVETLYHIRGKKPTEILMTTRQANYYKKLLFWHYADMPGEPLRYEGIPIGIQDDPEV
jgi:hypothetical protein